MHIRSLGKASVGDIARVMDRSPEAVHYHVKALAAAGLAKEAFRRAGVKKPEVVYEPVGKRVKLPRSDSPEIGALIRKSVAAGFRQSIRGYIQATRLAETEPSAKSVLHVIRMNARLAPNDAKEFIKRLDALVQFADQHRKEDGIRFIWSSIIYPAVSNKRPK